jgi:hypothetical protein
MKKIVYLSVISIVLLCALIFVLCACHSQNSQPSSETQPTSKLSGTEPPYMNSFSYDTVHELIKGITNDFTEEIMQEYEAYYGKEQADVFRGFISNLKDAQVSLYVPYYQNKEITFLNKKKEGYPSIILSPRDRYNEPFVRFYPVTEDIIFFSVMYIDEALKFEANENGAPWLMKQINPNGQGENAKPYPGYDTYEERELKLKDRDVKAFVGFYNDRQRKEIWFVYDGVLVTVTVHTDFDYEWLKELSFAKVNLKTGETTVEIID